MKRLHLRFYPYILSSVIIAILAIAMLAASVFMFIRVEIAMGIVFALLVIILNFFLWLILHGGIVINFKKNRLMVYSRGNNEVYAVDNIKEICISFRFDKKHMRWSANVTIYLKNGKLATFGFTPYEWRFFKYGIPLYNKKRIERKAEKCNLIKCYTAK